MSYYQMTFDELLNDSFRPIMEPIHQGSWGYICPVCKCTVGIRRVQEGFVYKRDVCKNGHRMEWEGI